MNSRNHLVSEISNQKYYLLVPSLTVMHYISSLANYSSQRISSSQYYLLVTSKKKNFVKFLAGLKADKNANFFTYS